MIIRNKKVALFFLIFIIGAFVFLYQYGNKREQDLYKNKVTTKGLITDMDVVIRGRGIYVMYTFNVDGKHVQNRKMIPIEYTQLKWLKFNLIGKGYPVVFDSLDKSNNEILLFKNEFVKYGLRIPDTLNHIFYLLDSLRYDKAGIQKQGDQVVN